MFSMIGGDGREYGPVTAEQIEEWILDQRANGQTLVLPEGSRDWRPLSSVPEFAAALAEAARRQATPPIVTVPPDELPLAEPYPAGAVLATIPGAVLGELRVFEALGRAWQVWQHHLPLITLASALVWGAQALPRMVPQVLGCAGVLASLAVSGAMYGGLSLLLLQLARGQPARLADVFACFDGRFLACLLVFVVTGLLEEIGLALCVLPGVFLGTIWAFSLPLAAVQRLGFSAALGASWRAVMPRFFTVLGLLALAFLPLVVFSAYSMARMVSHTFEILGPLGDFSLGTFRERLPEMTQAAATLGWQQQWVLLLNLPFAWTALMVAYDDLFSPRRQPSP